MRDAEMQHIGEVDAGDEPADEKIERADEKTAPRPYRHGRGGHAG